MTENEFLQLKIGTVVSNKWKKNTHFMIYDTDQMGTAYRGKKYIVYGARQMDHDKNLARIDIGSCQFWRVEGIATVIDGVWKQVLDKKRSKVSSKQNVEPK